MDKNLVSAGLGEGFVLLDSLNGASDYFEVEVGMDIASKPVLFVMFFWLLSGGFQPEAWF